MANKAQVYIEGWQACIDGEDGRFTNPYADDSDLASVWSHGFNDAMESEENELPNPLWAGY